MKRVAAMDLGSNTLRLLVADVQGEAWQPVRRELATPRVGRGLSPDGHLDPRAKAQALEAAAGFAALARELGAQAIALGATSACRRASDGPQFVAELGQRLNLEQAQVLSGQEEALISRRGVLSRLNGPAQGGLLADVGGGSCELGPLQGPGQVLSLPLGAVGLSELYLASDPPGPEELQALDQAVDQELEALEPGRYSRLVATAGTAATLAAMQMGLSDYQPERVNNLAVSRQALQEQFNRLAGMDLARRKQVPGMEPERADIILAGLAILRGLLARLELEELTTMDAGLLEGILLEAFAPPVGGNHRL